MKHILDACAMIAYLRGEPGAMTVAQMLKDKGTCYVHTMNLLEVYYGFVRRDGERRALQAMSDLATAGVIEKRTMNRAFVYRVGKLKKAGFLSSRGDFLSKQRASLTRKRSLLPTHYHISLSTAPTKRGLVSHSINSDPLILGCVLSALFAIIYLS